MKSLFPLCLPKVNGKQRPTANVFKTATPKLPDRNIHPQKRTAYGSAPFSPDDTLSPQDPQTATLFPTR
jgi:hypothetical protein